MKVHRLFLAPMILTGVSALAQNALLAKPAPVAASAPTVVPALVPYFAIAEHGDGTALTGERSVTFLLFRDQSGGDPLWTESQVVSFDSIGRYKVQLGASSTSGLPIDLFASGEGRWLEVQIAGEKPEARVLLSSVPYALKAADAATLGGLPVSAFVLAGTHAATALATGGSTPSLSPDTGGNVTTTGGSNYFLPKFTGATTVIDSQLYDNGTSIGVGVVPNPTAKLDVGGSVIMRGVTTISRTGNATSAVAYPSYAFDMFASAYDSATHANANPYFSLEAEPTGNNSSTPSATLNVLFSGAETGFHVNPNGTLHFATGQTFPGTGSGTITGVAAGTDLLGGGTSGNVAISLDTSKIITKVAAGTGLTGGGTTGTVTLNVDTSKIPTLTDSPVFTGSVTANSSTGNAITGNGTSNKTGVLGTSDGGYAGEFVSGFLGVYGISTASTGGYGAYDYAEGTNAFGGLSYAPGAGSYGLVGDAPGGPDSGGSPSVGVLGEVSSGFGVEGTASSGTGVFGVDTSESGVATTFVADGITGGVWGDTSAAYNSLGVIGGVVGTADDNSAAYFINNSNNYATLRLEAQGTGGTQFAGILKASSPYGSCGIGGKGDLTCTGQVKTLATTSASRKVETYAMQSPENWMEDFGSASLSGGKATVTIDPAFAETASTGADYHVFITPNGDSKGLYVVAKSATGFEVRESGGGTSSLSFDYRIVAKRKGYEGQRLVDVTERFNAEATQDLTRERVQTALQNRPTKLRLNARPRALQPPPPIRPSAIRTSAHSGN